MPSALCLPSALYQALVSGTRQTAALPSVSSETLGILLHSAYLWFAECQHSATIRHSAYLIFTECQHSASMGHSTITNTWPAHAPSYRTACQPLGLHRVSVRDTRRSTYLPSVFFQHSAKYMGLPSVYGDTRQIQNYFFLLGPPQFFYSPHTTFGTAC